MCIGFIKFSLFWHSVCQRLASLHRYFSVLKGMSLKITFLNSRAVEEKRSSVPLEILRWKKSINESEQIVLASLPGRNKPEIPKESMTVTKLWGKLTISSSSKLGFIQSGSSSGLIFWLFTRCVSNLFWSHDAVKWQMKLVCWLFKEHGLKKSKLKYKLLLFVYSMGRQTN